jgi:hypothetical protein
VLKAEVISQKEGRRKKEEGRRKKEEGRRKILPIPDSDTRTLWVFPSVRLSPSGPLSVRHSPELITLV